MKIATDTLGKTKTRIPKAERRTWQDEHSTIVPHECVSPKMGKVVFETGKVILVRGKIFPRGLSCQNHR